MMSASKPGAIVPIVVPRSIDCAAVDVAAMIAADRWNRAYTAGRRMSFDALLKDIDSVSRSLAPF
jgi:hypothetical protein